MDFLPYQREPVELRNGTENRVGFPKQNSRGTGQVATEGRYRGAGCVRGSSALAEPRCINPATAELRALRSSCNTMAYVIVRPPGRCCTRRIRQVTDGCANCQLKFTVQGLRTTRSTAICLACTKFLVEVHLHGARAHCRKIRRLCSQRSHRLQHTMGADTHSSKSWYLHARCFLARAYYSSFSPQ